MVGLRLMLKLRCAVSSAFKPMARIATVPGVKVLPLPAVPPSVMLTFIVDVSRAKVSMPAVFRLVKSLFETLRLTVELLTLVTWRPSAAVDGVGGVVEGAAGDVEGQRAGVVAEIDQVLAGGGVAGHEAEGVVGNGRGAAEMLNILTSPSEASSPKPTTVLLLSVKLETF